MEFNLKNVKMPIETLMIVLIVSACSIAKNRNFTKGCYSVEGEEMEFTPNITVTDMSGLADKFTEAESETDGFVEMSFDDEKQYVNSKDGELYTKRVLVDNFLPGIRIGIVDSDSNGNRVFGSVIFSNLDEERNETEQYRQIGSYGDRKLVREIKEVLTLFFCRGSELVN